MTGINNTSILPGLAKVAAIELQQLRFAVVASDSGSFRRTADLLSVRHSVVSRSIGQLEHLIGIALFERSSAGVRPTLAGRSVVRIARMVMDQVDALAVIGRSLGRREAGRISVGFCTSTSAGNLRSILSDFRKQFPHFELSITEKPRGLLMSALAGGTLDLLVVSGDTPSLDNEAFRLWTERVMVALPENHVLAGREVVCWNDLRNETVLFSDHDSSRDLEDLLISKLISPADRPKIGRHDVSRGLIKYLVCMNLGISLVLESDAGAGFAGLVYRELRDRTGLTHLEFAAHWRADNDNPALDAFLKLLAELYPSLTSGE